MLLYCVSYVMSAWISVRDTVSRSLKTARIKQIVVLLLLLNTSFVIASLTVIPVKGSEIPEQKVSPGPQVSAQGSERGLQYVPISQPCDHRYRANEFESC